ncbi:MAG: 2-octaprenyl-6-methoxyphenyl hydroxylase [Proteobacteria bacterium]|nr:2-octaprenyl-6-methoxyphenyl hydroxylase [Pseudomonadota bacterium]
MVGASLALALAPLPLRVAVIEAIAPEDGSQPSFDARTIALSNGTRRVFAGLGVWDEIGREATPIRRIHISDRGRFGSALIDAAEQGVPALGFVAPNRVIGRALWRRLRLGERTTLVAPARVTAAAVGETRVALTLATAAGTRHLTTRLAVAADGAASLVREAAGVGAARWDYEQVAVISLVATERFHEHVAYERFTPTGPLAVLPGPDGRVVVVWTLAPAEAARVGGLDDAAFLAELQQRFGWRLGRLLAVGARASYPLSLTQASAETAPRTAIIGNAAQGLHPIAGQGFNLGLRDAATLAEVLAEAVAESGPGADPGAAAVLDRYGAWRRTDRRALIAFTDGLVRLFASPFGPVRLARGLGLVLFDLSPAAKSAMSRLSLGFAARLPRLARGLPLIEPAADGRRA